MKNYKAIVLIILTFTLGTGAFAQLLERDNVTSRIRVGTRPQQGDFGFMFALSYAEIKEMTDDDLDIRGFPLMSFKYYLTDNLELRLNTQSYKKIISVQGTLVNQIGQEDNVDKQSFSRFMPSALYHFASTNLLDTYAGLGIIIGSGRNEILTTDKTNLTGDYVSNHKTKKTFVTGFNLTFGLQAFIADLPISLGLEVSVRGLKHSNLQYENVFSSSVGGVVTNQTYFSLDANDDALRYQTLEYKKFEMGADLRILLSYYFRR